MTSANGTGLSTSMSPENEQPASVDTSRRHDGERNNVDNVHVVNLDSVQVVHLSQVVNLDSVQVVDSSPVSRTLTMCYLDPGGHKVRVVQDTHERHCKAYDEL